MRCLPSWVSDALRTIILCPDHCALIGFGKMQFIILLSCFNLQIWMTNEQLGFGVIIAGASCEMRIHDRRLAWLMAASFAAQMVSCFLWGELADVYGRRKIIMITSTVANIVSILSACVPEFWGFLFLRSVGGFLWVQASSPSLHRFNLILPLSPA